MTIDEAEKIKTVIENKDYIIQLVNTVAKTMIEAFENLKIEDVNMFQLGYNKALDDFIENISLKISESLICGMIADCFKYKNMNDTSDKIVDYVINTANEIAEQLKAGVKNELQQSE